MSRVVAKPFLSSLDEVISLCGLRCAFKFCLAFLVIDPQDGILRIAVHLHVPTLLLDKGKRMDNGKELANVVGSADRTVMEQPLFVAQIHPLVFHWPRVATAACIDGNRIEVNYTFQFLVIHGL